MVPAPSMVGFFTELVRFFTQGKLEKLIQGAL
jgi:hypothetical protein